MQAMYIRVKRSKTTYFLQCDPTETILDIKQKLHALIDQPVTDQRLILVGSGEILEDSKTLAEQKVENDAVVALTLRKGLLIFPKIYLIFHYKSCLGYRLIVLSTVVLTSRFWLELLDNFLCPFGLVVSGSVDPTPCYLVVMTMNLKTSTLFDQMTFTNRMMARANGEQSPCLKTLAAEFVLPVNVSIRPGNLCNFTTRKPSVAVVGSGPSGLFATLVLAEPGANVTLIERGQAVEQWGHDIGALIRQLESNFCFGEVMKSLVHIGAPRNILIDGKPHLGTDGLAPLLHNFRHHLQGLSVTVKFGTRLNDLLIENALVVGVGSVRFKGKITDQQ
ncbi:Ubiquitin-like domain [Dillenia turbinata]|uniref:Ubiquitin-like domain n=1 Tax=Dillenia turbinata TaxID=194707 RepID=A0AAN8W5V0_9MAGN